MENYVYFDSSSCSPITALKVNSSGYHKALSHSVLTFYLLIYSA